MAPVVQKRLRIFPGIAVDVNASGETLQVSVAGAATLDIGPSGSKLRFGIPGTGLYWTKDVAGVHATDISPPPALTDGQAGEGAAPAAEGAEGAAPAAGGGEGAAPVAGAEGTAPAEGVGDAAGADAGAPGGSGAEAGADAPARWPWEKPSAEAAPAAPAGGSAGPEAEAPPARWPWETAPEDAVEVAAEAPAASGAPAAVAPTGGPAVGAAALGVAGAAAVGVAGAVAAGVAGARASKAAAAPPPLPSAAPPPVVASTPMAPPPLPNPTRPGPAEPAAAPPPPSPRAFAPSRAAAPPPVPASTPTSPPPLPSVTSSASAGPAPSSMAASARPVMVGESRSVRLPPPEPEAPPAPPRRSAPAFDAEPARPPTPVDGAAEAPAEEAPATYVGEPPSFEEVAAFTAALHALEEGDGGGALDLLRAHPSADASFLLGLLLVDAGADIEEAAERLEHAADNFEELGRFFGLVEWDCTLTIAVVGDQSVVVRPDRLGAEIVLAEALQLLGRHNQAIARLRALPQRDDPVVMLSVADLRRTRG